MCPNSLLDVICKLVGTGLIPLFQFDNMALNGDTRKEVPLFFARGRKEAEFLLVYTACHALPYCHHCSYLCP